MRGITAAGIYLPKFRLSSDETENAWGTAHTAGIDKTAVPAADEDSLTMAIAAAERALNSTSVTRTTLEIVAAATTTPPLEEGDFVSQLVRALDLPSDVASTTSTQHTAATAEALNRALDADGPALVVAADCPEGDPAEADHSFGAGAAAFIIDDDPAVTIRDISWASVDSPGIRFRQRGECDVESLGITTYEREKVREAITSAVTSLHVNANSATAAAVHQRDGKFPYRVTGDLAIPSEAIATGTVVNQIGDAGTATVPIGLLSALNKAEEIDLVIGAFFGGGSSAAVACEGTLSVAGIDALEEGEAISYTSYLRERGYVVDNEVAGGGAHVSLPNWRQSLDQRYNLIAGQCPECSSITFPPEGACQACHTRVDFEAIETSRTGTVRAVTVIGQGGAPPEFAEFQQQDGAYAVAIIDLDTGEETVSLPAQLTDTDPESVAVGDTVQATIRKIYTQEGVPRYGVKFKPTG